MSDVANQMIDVLVNAIADRLLTNESFIEKLAANINVDSDNIGGLEDLISEKIETAIKDIDVDEVRGFEQAVEREVNSALEHFEVDADDVNGLSRFVEEALEEFEVQAEDIKGLDDAITETIAGSKDIGDELKKAVFNNLTVQIRSDGNTIAGGELLPVS